MWVKEIISDPAICSAHCCKCGFDRAGVTCALYGVSDGMPDVDSILPLPQCTECSELAVARSELPSCEHFAEMDIATLCNGCYDNHANICAAV